MIKVAFTASGCGSSVRRCGSVPQQFNKTGAWDGAEVAVISRSHETRDKGVPKMAVSFTKVDLEYLLTQIQMAETNHLPS